jgi:hypothetical protein
MKLAQDHVQWRDMVETSGSAITMLMSRASKVKVNLSLCLTKYHAMKTYPVLNQAPRYEDVLGVGV